MYFDFFNYTFSAIISFVTAIFGMSYPLLVESINKLDEKYPSHHVKERFEESIVLKLFNSFLIMSVSTAIIIPFVLVALESNKLFSNLLISLQMMILSLLVFQTMFLIRQIQLYNNPRRLMNYILQTATKRDLNVVIDVIKSISKGEDLDLYKQGMQWIVNMITEENVNYGRV